MLMRAEDNECHWCRAPLVMLGAVGPIVINWDADRVYWLDEHGNEWSCLYATIDHVIPLRDYPPGPLFKHRFPPSHPLNLVVSCAPCNRARSLEVPEIIGESSLTGVDIRYADA